MGKILFEYDFATEEDIPVIFCYPEGAQKLPLVFFNHGTGDTALNNLSSGIKLAQEGLFIVLMDARFHGRRRAVDFDEKFQEKNYKETYLNMLLGTCKDISSLIDLLESDPRIDASRIGTTGISQGGYVSFMSITLDKRIKAAAPMIGSPDLEDKYGNSPDFDSLDQKLKESVIKHSPLRNYQKMPPTALLIQNGVKDNIVPVGGTRRLNEKLEPLYKDMPEKYLYIEYPELEHTVPDVMMEQTIKWLSKQLQS